MSRTVDDRVVEMRFDNRQFEQNVQTSLSTLDKLKKSLNLETAAKSFENIEKASGNISFNKIQSSVEAIERRFSTLGIVGMRIIQNLTDSLMNFVGKTTRFLSSSIINGGITRAMNLENAHFQLQGLLKDEEAVQAVMKNVNDSVDGTAYSLDSAAKVASQFTASGMTAGDKMYSSLRAVAGVAAMTNSEYDSIGQIFTTVAGNGRLMGDQLLQLSSRGMNAAATLASYLGKTESEIREMVSKGEISFETFAMAMDDAFGEHAKKANETFTGAMSNVKASLARIGAEFVSPLVDQNGVLVDFFNALRERINDVKANIGPLADMFVTTVSTISNAATKYLNRLDLTKHFESFYNVVDTLRNILGGIGSVLKLVGQGFRDVFPPITIETVADFTAKLKELTANLKLNNKDASNLRSTFKGLFAILDIFGKGIGAIVKAIFPMTEGVGSLASGILSITGKIGECLTSLNEATGPVLELFNEHINGVVTAVREFVKTHFGVPDISGLENFADKFKTRFSPLGKICAVVKTAIEKVADAFKAAAPVLAKAGENIVDAIGKVLHGEGFDSLIDLLNGGLMVGIGTGIMKFIENLQSTINKAGGMFSNVNRILFNVKNTLISYQASIKADILMKIAKAIAILAASLLVLSLIDSDKLGGALAAITILFSELAASMAVFDKTLRGKGGLIGTGIAMIELSAALLILSTALKKIAGIDSDKLFGALAGITVLIGEMVAASITLSKWGNKTQISAAAMILFAEAINILAKAVKKLSELDTNSLIKGLVGAGVLISELAVFMAVSQFGNFKATQGFAVIELAAALLVLEKAVVSFGSLNMETIGKGLLGIAGTLTVITAALQLMPKNMIGIGLGLIEVAVALKIIGSVVQSVGSMKWEEIGKSLLILASSLAVLAVSLHVMNGTLGASAAMLVMATALAIFTPMLKSLGSMSLTQIGKAILSLASAFTVLGIAGAVLSPMVPSILGLSAALALLGVAVTTCGAGVLAFSAGLATLAVSGTAGVAALVTSLEILITGVLNIIACSAEAIAGAVKAIVLSVVDVVVECAPAVADGVLTLVEEVLKSLASHTPNIVTYLMDFLIGVINALADKLPDLIKAAVNLIGSFFQGVADALSGINTGVLLKGIVGIGLLSAIMAALSVVAALVPGAMVGVLGMGAVIAELALILAAVGIIAQIPGLSWLINEGGEFLESIGTAIGKFIGGIVGGVMSGITSRFPQIGIDLSSFMTNVQPFIDGASRIQPSMIDGAKALVETILLLTAADLLQGVTSWITGGSSLTDFATQLVPFGEAMVGFSNVISGMDADLVAKAAIAGKTLAEMASTLPNSGGILGFFSGENDMGIFGEQLIPFGKAMMNFSNTVKGLDADVVVNAATAGKAIAEMASTLPNSGGVVGFFAGENDMGTFGEQLVPFGKAMKSYSDEVAGIDAGAITNSATAGKALVELANTLPNTGGVVSWFTGDNDIGDFGERLIEFGKNFSAYSDYMKNVDSGIVTATANAASSIVKLEKSLPESGGWFSDDTTLAEFGEDIELFGSYFSSFYNHISKVSVSALTGVICEMGNLISLSKDMNGIDTSGMGGFGKALTTMGKNGINEFLKVFKDATSKVETSAKSLITSFTSGISTGKETVVTSMTTLVTNAVNAVHNKHSDFYNTGKYMVEGFANGISSNSFMASAKAAEMAKAAVNATNAELGVHSPSKVFAQIGGYVVSGFSNGINSNKGKAAKSTKGLAKVGVDAAKAVLKSLKGSDSVFKEYAENTDKNGKKIKMTLKTAAEAFKSFRNSVKDSIKDSMGVFDEFAVETDITGKELLKNLKSQITGITEWASNIRILADRGINKGLLKVLSDMGPSGAKYVNSLVTMSNKELKKLNKLYKQRLSLNSKAADEIATSFLDGGKKAAKAYSKGVSSGSKAKSAKMVSVTDSIKSSTSATVKAVETMKEKIQSIMTWTYEETVQSVKKSLDYGKGAFSQFCKAYLSSTKNITLGTKAINAASSAITAYGKKLYEESDYYAEDTANLKTHKKELFSLQKERIKLQKQLQKAQKSNAKASKARAKALKAELKSNNKAIKEAKKQVKADENEVAIHTKEVFDEIHNTLAESVSTFLDPLKVSLESGIDLFKKFESNTDLYEADKKNLEQHQKTLSELEATQKEILDEISKYSDKNTLAARKRVKELNAQLSEVESSIEEVKSNIEQAENDMVSHSNVTVDSILENMQSQITGVTKWQQNLRTLAARGVSQGLLEELKKMGTDGVDYVDQFMKMTSDEIAKANSLFAQSANLTSQTLISNFQDSLNETKNWAADLQKMAEMGFSQDLLQKIGEMGVDGYEYVSAFLTMTPDQIAQFNQQFAESLKLPDTVADQVISSYAYAGGQSIAGFTSALAKLTENGSDENAALVAMATEIGNVISTTLKEESKSGGKKAVDELSKSMKKNKKTAKDGSKSVGKATLKGLKEVLNDTAGKKVANNIVSGLKNGLNNGKSSVSATAEAVAKAAYKAAKAALGIKSPSRMFAKLGKYTDAGFVKGLESGERDIYNTATDIMGKTIKDIYAALNSDVETQPTIRPIMDLTDIQNGANEIGNIMNGYSIAGSLKLANATANAMNRSTSYANDSTLNIINKLQDTLSSILGKPSIEQNNNFNIQGNNPKEIADEVSHILQKQVERRNVTWA